MRKFFLLLLLVPMLLLSGCGIKVPSDMIAVHMGSGPFENKKPKGCEKAGTRDNSITNDDYVLIPTSEREWDATGQKGSDGSSLTSVTKDSVVMKIPVTVRFTVKTDCPTATDFYLKYMRRYDAEFDSDGTYNSEWITLLRKLVKDPTDQTLDRIVQDYNWRSVWNDPKVKVEIEDQLTKELQGDNSLLVQTAHKAYFEDISVLVGTPKPQNSELAKAAASTQTKVAQSEADKAQADADTAKATAQVAVSKAEAAKKRAEVEGYGGIEGYLKYKAVENGLNPWQPTYVVSGTAPGK